MILPPVRVPWFNTQKGFLELHCFVDFLDRAVKRAALSCSRFPSMRTNSPSSRRKLPSLPSPTSSRPRTSKKWHYKYFDDYPAATKKHFDVPKLFFVYSHFNLFELLALFCFHTNKMSKNII